MKKFTPNYTGRFTTILAVAILAVGCKQKEETAPETSASERQARPATREVTADPGTVAETPEPLAANPAKNADDKPSPDATADRPAPKVTVIPPEIVTDPTAIVMDQGFPQPKRGDKIYVWANLPGDACGEYWVKGSNGKVSKVAVCRDQH